MQIKTFCVGMSLIWLSGCQALDSAMSTTDGILNKTGDILSGDFRGLGPAKKATLSEIWRDWQQNEITAKRKWDTQRLEVPGIITRITKTGEVISQNQIAIIFKDPTNSSCKGQALTRDELKVNMDKISHLKVGDRVTVTGVLGTTESKWSAQNECWFSFDKAEIIKIAK
ncbi:lipoprotein [Acinetobacter sp. A47]|uniref:lipoprotein n=1 Tax=Acinetobacter sp. A47 TaxID=1561217 RepID=UPI000570A96D|nr:lipoprotein [Acinetobacter sp. A47]